MNEGHIKEEGLRDWFGKSKSKDGKKGWVNVVTGDSCASDKPGEGIPKCVSSAKRASMSKKERLAAAAAKRRKDPGQQQKTGAAKPTMVKTDRKTRKEEMEITEAPKYDKQGLDKFDRSKRMIRHKQDKYGVSTLKQRIMHGGVDHNIDNEKKAKKTEVKEGDGDPCWDTHKQVGMKKKGGKMVPNCVPKNEEVEIQNEGAAWTKKSGKNPSGGLNEKGRKSYEAENPGSDLKRPSKKVGNKRRASFCARMKGMKKKLTSKKTANDPDSRINKSLRAWNC